MFFRWFIMFINSIQQRRYLEWISLTYYNLNRDDFNDDISNKI
jgi:hypothetical protein